MGTVTTAGLRGRLRRSLRALLALLAIAALATAAYGAFLSFHLRLPKSEDHPPLLIYGAPFLLKPDMAVDESRLMERLQRLGYRAVKEPVRSPGEYRATEQAIDIYLHAHADSHVQARPISLLLDHGRVADIIGIADGTPAFPVYLEPQLLSGLRGEQRQVREWIPYAAIPRRVIDTVLAVEDRRFFYHPGIDPIAVGRALWANVMKRGVMQGGSTITQQLAKNLFYSPERTLWRKFRESLAAFVLEIKYSKEEILESYLNEIYLGQAGSVSIYGVGEAAHRYFGKSLDELTVEETALVAGMIKGPNTYAPTRNLGLAKQRRDAVLSRLRDQGLLDEERWKAAVNRSVRVMLPKDALTDAPYFVDYVLRQIEDAGGTGIPEGTRIYTTLDPVAQDAAVEALQKGLARLESIYPFLRSNDEPLQAAMVVLDPRTGRVLAMVGGRDYRVSQFNRAVQARRQAGSLFKPFVYAAALEAGREAGASAFTPATLLADEPVAFASTAGPWTPQNYDRQFRGQVTLRTALEQSLNVPAVRVAKAVGTKPVLQLIRNLGVRSPLAEDLSIALGSSAVSLLEMTSAYGGLAHQGVLVHPTAVQSLVDVNGDTLWTATPDRRQALSAQAAYVVTSLLRGVVDRGTAAQAKAMGVPPAVAGKTGTTDGYRDAWFIGYRPDLVVGVWVGFDDERPVRLTGSQAALPIWADAAKRLLPAEAPDFPMPSGIVERAIDPSSGQLATGKCPEQVSEVFIEGTEPSTYCTVHGGGLWERLKRSFGFS